MSGPRLLDVRTTPVEDFDVKPIVEHLRGGGLLAYPTETVYGFGGVATDSVVNRLASLKGRGAKPMLMLVQVMGAVGDLIWTREATDLADVFWPGSVTLILSDPNERYPAGLRGDSGGVAVRVSPHPLVAALLEGLDGSLVSTSANQPGQPPALDARRAMESAASLGADDDLWVLDGGTLPESPPSTIVDCSEPTPVVVRQGTIPLARVRCVLPEIQAAAHE